MGSRALRTSGRRQAGLKPAGRKSDLHGVSTDSTRLFSAIVCQPYVQKSVISGKMCFTTEAPVRNLCLDHVLKLCRAVTGNIVTVIFLLLAITGPASC